jgi:hypothetical protein
MQFTARSNSFCADASTSIAKLKTPTEPKAQLQYAMDRYAAMEKAVSELTDSSLPGGDQGEQLRAQWLRPARASLKEGLGTLEQLRQAIKAEDRERVQSAYQRSRNIGTDEQAANLLDTDGLTACSRLFRPEAA